MQIHLLGGLEDLEDTLLGKGRGEDDGEIDKRCHTFTDGIGKGVDDHLCLIFHQIPLVDHYHKTLVVLLDELEDVHILRLDTTGGVKHQDTHVAVLDSPDGTHHGVELQILCHLVLTTDTSGIHQVEVEAKLIVTGIDGVAGGTGNLRHDVTILADEGVDDARLAGIRTTYHRKAGDAFLQIVLGFLGQHPDDLIEQVAGTTAGSGADGPGITQSELIELILIVEVLTVVCLVGDQDHRQLGTPQDLSHVHVPARHTVVDVTEEQHQVGFLSGNDHLFTDLLFKDIV